MRLNTKHFGRYSLLVLVHLYMLNMSAQDTQAPVINSPSASMSVPCNVPGIMQALGIWYNSAGGANVTDNSGIVSFIGNPEFAEAQAIFIASTDTLCGLTQSVTVTFIAVDGSGNQTAPMTATFSSIDNLSPAVEVFPQNYTMDCKPGARDTMIQWIRDHGGSSATDGCSESVLWDRYIYSSNIGQVGHEPIATGPYPLIPQNSCNYILTVSFSVLDQCGNKTNTPNRKFTIVDTKAPILSSTPADITVKCDQIPPPQPITANDDCSGARPVTFTETSTKSADSLSCAAYNYEITRKWESSDPCQNTVSYTQKITVRDIIPPFMDFISPANVQCGQTSNQYINLVILDYGDACSPAHLAFVDQVNGGGCTYFIHRTYTVSDVCGNSATAIQIINVTDTLPPTLTKVAQNKGFDCNSSNDVQLEFDAWILDRGGATASDNCTGIRYFPALSGSYNINDTTTFPGIYPTDFVNGGCATGGNGFSSSLNVDFVFYDHCGNAQKSAATFGITDHEIPEIPNCLPLVTKTLGSQECETLLALNIPESVDNCTQYTSPLVRNASQAVSYTSPSSSNEIVSPVELIFGPYNANTVIPIASPVLTFEYKKLDADDIDEYFLIYDENDVLIGQSTHTPAQCEDAAQVINNISIATLQQWLSDGVIKFKLIPNASVFPAGSINAICPGARVNATLSFEIDPQNEIKTFISINAQDTIDLIGQTQYTASLQGGIHQANFIYEDCAGNVGNCITNIQIVDQTNPNLNCGPNSSLSYILKGASCVENLSLPIQVNGTDNCPFTIQNIYTAPSTEEGKYLSFNYIEPLNLHLATNKLISFTNVDKIKYVDDDAILDVEIFGDVNDAGEFFSIVGENGFILGNSNIIPGTGCQLSKTQFLIPKANYNQWANDGVVNITVIANNSQASEGSGINPCIVLPSTESLDFITKVSAKLTVSGSMLTYAVGGATTIPETVYNGGNDSLPLSLNIGLNQLTYSVFDRQNNKGSCNVSIEISDTLTPKALCRNATIFIHPSGLIPYEISSADLDVGSNDNCGNINIAFAPSVFSCTDIGQQRTVIMTVTDIGGNTSTCQSQVRVESTKIVPTYTSGLCEGDTLKFFANAPTAPQENSYTFTWFRNGILFSSEENPVIPNANEVYNDNYELVITGFNGCEARGTMIVNIKPLSTPILTTDKNSYCNEEEVTLSATSFPGNITYKWYEGIFPNGLLLQTTTTPELVITPTSQTHRYYIIAESEACISNPSANKKIDIFAPPTATVKSPFITLCEEDDLVIGTDVIGINYQYFWKGPDGYTNMSQNPPVIKNVDINKQGIYSLVIKIGECESDTATSTVVVFPKPQKPQISGEFIYCEGSTFSLAINNVGPQDKYKWYRDTMLFTTTLDNTLEVPNALPTLTGKWTAIVESNGCKSDRSEIKEIVVENLPNVGASNNGPGCAGDSVTLNATFVPNATYKWSGPGITNLSGLSIKIPAKTGDYTVTITTSTGCSTPASTTVEVVIPPTITALSNDSKNCMDGNTAITFFPTVFPLGNYTYHWQGPGFTSNQKNAVIANARPENNGSYVLTVFDRGCPSISVNNNISINLIPSKAIISGVKSYCEGDTIKLTAVGSAEEYHWLTPIGSVVNTNNNLVIANSQISNQGYYKVKLKANGCESAFSDSIRVDIFQNPAPPTISGGNVICFGDSLKLTANTAFSDVEWIGPDGKIFSGVHLLRTNADKSMSGIYKARVKSGSCISILSSEYNVEILDEIKRPEFTTTSLELCTDFPGTEQICLNTSIAEPNANYLLFNSSNGILLQSKNTLCFDISDIHGLILGDNLLYATTQIGNCYSEKSNNLLLSLKPTPSIKASIKADALFACHRDDLIALSTENLPFDILAAWHAINSNVTISTPNDLSTIISNLQSGPNLISLQLSSSACKNFSRDTIAIFLVSDIESGNDNYQINLNQTKPLDILGNDIYDNTPTISILDGPQHGKAAILNDKIIYSPDTGYAGDDEFVYELCADLCEDNCDQATVTLSVAENVTCQPPTIITPNKDGINDEFVIPCLSRGKFPENKLIIFNQWGDQVYFASPYNNDWAGTFGGEDLPVGTYFFVFKRNREDSGMNGFLVIQR